MALRWMIMVLKSKFSINHWHSLLKSILTSYYAYKPLVMPIACIVFYVFLIPYFSLFLKKMFLNHISFLIPSLSLPLSLSVSPSSPLFDSHFSFLLFSIPLLSSSHIPLLWHNNVFPFTCNNILISAYVHWSQSDYSYV